MWWWPRYVRGMKWIGMQVVSCDEMGSYARWYRRMDETDRCGGGTDAVTGGYSRMVRWNKEERFSGPERSYKYVHWAQLCGS